MRLFKLESKFNSRTGKPLAPELVEGDLICDYKGTIIETGGEFGSSYSIKVNEIGGCEECYYYDDHILIDKIKKYASIDQFDVLAQLNESEYVFAVCEDGYDKSVDLLGEWLEAKEGSYFIFPLPHA